MGSSNGKNNEAKKPTPYDDCVSRADLFADLQNLRQDMQQYQAQLQQIEQQASQLHTAIERTGGAIAYLQMRLQPAQPVEDDTTEEAAEGVTEG